MFLQLFSCEQIKCQINQSFTVKDTLSWNFFFWEEIWNKSLFSHLPKGHILLNSILLGADNVMTLAHICFHKGSMQLRILFFLLSFLFFFCDHVFSSVHPQAPLINFIPFPKQSHLSSFSTLCYSMIMILSLLCRLKFSVLIKKASCQQSDFTDILLLRNYWNDHWLKLAKCLCL